MDGDAAPLSDAGPGGRGHDAIWIVDEAHAFGVLGPGGRGLCAARRRRARRPGRNPGQGARRRRRIRRREPASCATFWSTAPGRSSSRPRSRPPSRPRRVRPSSWPPARRATGAGRASGTRVDLAGDAPAALLARAGSRRRAASPAGPILPFVLGTEARALAVSAGLADARNLRPGHPSADGSGRVGAPAASPCRQPTSTPTSICWSGHSARRSGDSPSRGPRARRACSSPGPTPASARRSISAALLRYARRRGIWRRSPSSRPRPGATPEPADARALWRAACAADPRGRGLPLRAPAPRRPARRRPRRGVRIDLERIADRADRPGRQGGPAGRRGGGRVCWSPTPRDATGADLAKRLGLPLLVVARTALGTVNHTALTLREAARNGLDVAGLILNRTTGTDGPARGGQRRAHRVADRMSRAGHLSLTLPPEAAARPGPAGRCAGAAIPERGAANPARARLRAQRRWTDAQAPAAGRSFG